jgi:hypothetical protein
VAELAAKHPEKNNVQIAELAGVSEGTVRNVRKSMSQDYDIEPHLRKDGKPYPAKLKPREDDRPHHRQAADGRSVGNDGEVEQVGVPDLAS